MIFSPTCCVISVEFCSTEEADYIDYTDERPCLLFHRFIVLLVVSDPPIIILDCLVWVPATILYISSKRANTHLCQKKDTRQAMIS